MCGRYALHSNPDVVALQFDLCMIPDIKARYNIRETINAVDRLDNDKVTRAKIDCGNLERLLKLS